MTRLLASSNRAPLALPGALLITACALALTATPAQAEQVHQLLKSFSLPESASPHEPAVNQSTGEVYVSDEGGAVYAFEASGAPDPTRPVLTEADGTTPFHFQLSYGVAVDNSGGPDHGDIYVADLYGGTVTQFGPSGARTAQPQITVANIPPAGTNQSDGLPVVRNNHSFSPSGVAVASNGDVYVADQSNNVIDLFEPDGTFVSQLAAGRTTGPQAIALGPSGNIYAAQEYGGPNGLVEFNTSGACLSLCAPVDSAAWLGVAVDHEGNVYADEYSNRIVEFGPSSSVPIQTFGEGILAFRAHD